MKMVLLFSKRLFLLLFTGYLISACQKVNIKEEDLSAPLSLDQMSRASSFSCGAIPTVCEDCSFQNQLDNQEGNMPTVLGSEYVNPYSISVMTQAYNNIFTPSVSSVPTSHYYVKFKPSNSVQLNILEELDIELYDYPLSKNVLQDGDYWPDAYSGLADTELPWLYSVVESNFQFPANIQYQILQSLYIPADLEALEDEAFYITGNLECDSLQYKNEIRPGRIAYYSTHLLDPCDVSDCGGGGTGGGGTGGGTMNPQKPAGQINFKTYLTTMANARLGAGAPLKHVRVVGKRFFKIDKTYTDRFGNFRFSKRFPKKVSLVVKFKASANQGGHSVRVDFKNLGFWKSMFPLKKNIGTYKGSNLQNLNYEFVKGASSAKRNTKQWIAAVIMNTADENRVFLSQNNLMMPPNDLRFYLYAIDDQTETPVFDFYRRSNAPYLNQDRNTLNDIIHWGAATITAAATVFVAAYSGFTPGGAALTTALAVTTFTLVPHHPDVYFHYRTSDISSMTATKVSMSMGQQLGILYLYKVNESSSASGATRFTYLECKKYTVQRHPYDTYSPFGNGVPDPTRGYKPDVVAIWEGFAQHYGNVLTDRIYGIDAESFQLQGKTWSSDPVRSSNMKYLENFDPRIAPPADYFSWIPVGLINDLMDNTLDPSSTGVIDNVSGFTYLDIQSVLLNKPSEMVQFKNLLKAIRPAQSLQLDQLFTSYGY